MGERGGGWNIDSLRDYSCFLRQRGGVHRTVKLIAGSIGGTIQLFKRFFPSIFVGYMGGITQLRAERAKIIGLLQAPAAQLARVTKAYSEKEAA